VASVTLCDKDEQRLKSVADRFGIERCVRDVADIIAAPDIDAIHLCTGIPDHCRTGAGRVALGQALRLRRFRLATRLDDLTSIVAEQRPRSELYDDGNRRIYPPIPVCQGAAGSGRLRSHPVPARRLLPGSRQPALLLGRHAADVVCHARRRTDARHRGSARRQGALLRVRRDA